MSVPKIEPVKGMRSFTTKQPPYKHLEGHLPTRQLLVGASGSGKGVYLQSAILDVYRDCFARIVIFSPTASSDHTWEPVYRYIRKNLKVPEEEQIAFDTFDVDALNSVIDTQKRIIKYQKDHNQKQLHGILIVVDDFAGDESVMRHKKGEAIKNLFLMGRHFAISCIVSIQKYRLASSVMRTQATLLIWFKSRSQIDLDAFLEENSALVPGGKKQLMEIYRIATAEPFSFLVVNMMEKDLRKSS